jgi:O-antigen/teichoic acid export membrane protein
MSSTPAMTGIGKAISPASGSVVCGPVQSTRAAVESLRIRVQRASIWTTIAYIAMQGLRLVNSLILARLLVPDQVGLMVMVSVFMQGLEMFSDIGTGPAIIQNKRGNQMEFLNTAWTMQVVRGFLLWIASCVGAYPISVLFNDSRLLWLIPVAGFGSVIFGFSSTALVYLNRELDLRQATILEIIRQIITIVVTVVWALQSPTVWALVAGSFAGILYETVYSHFVLPGHRNRFHWNWEDARSMIRFGRWIFVSTALTFFAMQLDKMLMGNLKGTGTLALYGWAAQFATLPPQFIKKIGAQVGFPMLSEIARERPEVLYQRLRLVRLALVGLSLLVLLPMILFGDLLIQLLYPPIWHGAGWMLQILAAGAVGCVVISTYGSALMAVGRTFWPMFLLITQLALLTAAALIGNHFYGMKGFIVGIALVEWLNYPFTAFVMIRQRLWQPEIDLPALLISAVAVALAFVI